jgi:hypothetical protein
VELELAAASQAGVLLYFIFGEAPSLPITPRVDLAHAERLRLQRYTAAIAQRYTAAAAVHAASLQGGGDSSSALQVRPSAARMAAATR